MRPPFPYYGGKDTLRKHILPLVEAADQKKYAEIFFGGGAIFWRKRPHKIEYVNDLNDFVVAFLEVCQSSKKIDELVKLIELSLHSRTLFQRAQLIYRDPKGSTDIEMAWSIWYQCVNAFGAKLGYGGWNAGVKSPDVTSNAGTKTWSARKHFIASKEKFLERLSHVQIENKPANYVLERCAKVEDLIVYIDPPYLSADMGHYKGMYTLDDWNDTLDILKTAKCKFILSSYPEDGLSDFIKKNGFQSKSITQRIAVLHHSQSSRLKQEVITYNFKPNQLQFDFCKMSSS